MPWATSRTWSSSNNAAGGKARRRVYTLEP